MILSGSSGYLAASQRVKARYEVALIVIICALLVLFLMLVFGIPFSMDNLYGWITAQATGAVLWFTHLEYEEYKSLGPGGTPCNFIGFLKVKFLGIFALRDPFVPPPVLPSMVPHEGYLMHPLPSRHGLRPRVLGIAPQRQITQCSTAELYSILSKAISNFAVSHSDSLMLNTSCFEKHSTGLFVKRACNPATTDNHCHKEVCHSHPSDGSLHMTLHPADIAKLLDSGWGQRHPLAKGGWFRRFVPREFVMVYAPRTTEEVSIVMDIVRAAVGYVSGEKLIDGREEVADGELECAAKQGRLFYGGLHRDNFK